MRRGENRRSDLVYEHLKSEILGGKIAPISKLNESLIASKYSVSRTPVREALKKLESEGLIVRKDDGYYVLYLSKDQVVKLYEVRAVLEALAAEKAAEVRPQQKLAQLEEVMAKILEIKDRADPATLAEYNGRFHDIIAEMSSNEYLVELLKDIRNRLKAARITLFTSAERREREIEEHMRVFELVKKGDREGAREEMYRHELNVLSFLKESFLKEKVFLV